VPIFDGADPLFLEELAKEMVYPKPQTPDPYCIDKLLVRIHFIIVMIRWTGLAPWEFEFPYIYLPRWSATSRQATQSSRPARPTTFSTSWSPASPARSPSLLLDRQTLRFSVHIA